MWTIVVQYLKLLRGTFIRPWLLLIREKLHLTDLLRAFVRKLSITESESKKWYSLDCWLKEILWILRILILLILSWIMNFPPQELWNRVVTILWGDKWFIFKIYFLWIKIKKRRLLLQKKKSYSRIDYIKVALVVNLKIGFYGLIFLINW